MIESIDDYLKSNPLVNDKLNAVFQEERINWNRQKAVYLSLIVELRKMFASISLSMLKPDLVIMDEFQRFKDLLNTDSNSIDMSSEQSMLNHEFLYSNNTKVLLLSATPYKTYNSPFRPFVLATTSIGQEGLDFHMYSRKVVHWNLPSNPIDIEQREERINRYMCHAIRQNLADTEVGFGKGPFKENIWNEIMENAAKSLKGNHSDLVPYWCLPEDFNFKYKIERIVPMYPYSKDMIKYRHLINVLSIYRLSLGQPKQEELLDTISK